MNKGAKKNQAFDTGVTAGNILLIEDEEVVVDVAEQVLDRAGYHVVTASDGVEAVQLLSEYLSAGRHLDAVIMDLELPGELSGLKLVDKILGIDPNMAVIISSGYTEDKMMQKHEDYGLSGRLSKPYGARELIDCVRSAIEKNISVVL